MALQNRMARELRAIENEPPEGISAWPVGDSITNLQAQIQGPEGSVYENGLFHLHITVPSRYPFEPPKVQFSTPVYHPNIDSSGRICLDMLKPKPSGVWAPCLNICTVLAGVRQLLREPNPDDPLMADITEEYLHNRALFDVKARDLVVQHSQGQDQQQQQQPTEAQQPQQQGGGSESIAIARKRKQPEEQEQEGDKENIGKAAKSAQGCTKEAAGDGKLAGARQGAAVYGSAQNAD